MTSTLLGHPHALLRGAQVLLFITGTPSNPTVDGAQRAIIHLLDAKRVAYTTVDCAEPSNKAQRDAAWAVSGKRVVYPQLFKRGGDGALVFLGTWDDIERMNESNEHLHELDALLEGLARK